MRPPRFRQVKCTRSHHKHEHEYVLEQTPIFARISFSAIIIFLFARNWWATYGNGGGGSGTQNDTVDFKNVWQAQIYLISMESLIVGEHRTGIFSLITWNVWFLFRCVAHGKNKNRSRMCVVSKMSRYFNFCNTSSINGPEKIEWNKFSGAVSCLAITIHTFSIRFSFFFSSFERTLQFYLVCAVYSRLKFFF